MKNKIEQQFNEQAEKYGEKVTAKVFVGRHGEKKHDPNSFESVLTEHGKENSAKLGKTREKVDMKKPYSSNTERTKETSIIIAENSPASKLGNYRERAELSFDYDYNGAFAKEAKAIKDKILGPDYNELDEAEFNNRLKQASNEMTNYFLNFKDKRPDPKTDSPIEAASNMAKILLHYIEMTEKLKTGSTVDLINITHDLNIAAFLKEIISDKDNDNDSADFKIESIGGAIDFNEGFELTINRADKNNFSLNLSFRGKEYNIDKETLENLAKAKYKK